MRKAVGMRQSKRPWVTKLRPEMTAKIVDDPKGRGKMLVPTPLLVAEEIQKTKVGELVSPAEIRIRLAQRFKADLTCPLTTGIFINILAGAAEEELKEAKPVTAAYWRVVDEKGFLSEKTPPGPELQARHLKEEGHIVERVKKKWRCVRSDSATSVGGVMQKEEDRPGKGEKQFAAVCGLYCEACRWFIATTEHPARLKILAAEAQYTEEESRY